MTLKWVCYYWSFEVLESEVLTLWNKQVDQTEVHSCTVTAIAWWNCFVWCICMLFVNVGSGLGLHDDNDDDTTETQTDTLLLYEPQSLFYRFLCRDNHGVTVLWWQATTLMIMFHESELLAFSLFRSHSCLILFSVNDPTRFVPYQQKWTRNIVDETVPYLLSVS